MSKKNWQSNEMKRVYKCTLENLQTEIENKGMSYERFKEVSNISDSTFDKWELLTMLTKTTVNRCASVLEIERTKLISDNDYAKLHKGHDRITKEQQERLEDMSTNIRDVIGKEDVLSFDDISSYDDIEDALLENEITHLFSTIKYSLQRVTLLLKKAENEEDEEDDQ